MGDGGIPYFLIFLFVLWVLETIAKARRRSQLPDETGEEEIRLPAPPTTAGEVEPRAPSHPPRTLWEEIAEIARQHQQQQIPPGPLPPGPVERTTVGPSRPDPTPRARPTGETRTQTTRWEQGIEREVVVRPEGAEPPASEERRSDRWGAGSTAEAAPEEVMAAPRGRVDMPTRQVDRRGGAPPPAPGARRGTAVERPPSRQPTRRREGGRPVARPPAKPPAVQEPGRSLVPATLTPAPAASAGGFHVEGARALRGATRTELRRILVLQEVLAPPVAIRAELGIPHPGNTPGDPPREE